jgi:hypothetical protein
LALLTKVFKSAPFFFSNLTSSVAFLYSGLFFSLGAQDLLLIFNTLDDKFLLGIKVGFGSF